MLPHIELVKPPNPLTPVTNSAKWLTRGVGRVGEGVSEMLFEPVTRLGVTGLARAGKTVFITSLVSNLTAQARMGQVAVLRDGRLEIAYLQPQPDDLVPRFALEQHQQALLSDPPQWPSSTRSISQLRLSFKVQPAGMLASLAGPRTSHLDIVDYPGEWLLDLALLETTYARWSSQTLKTIAARPALSEAWHAVVEDLDPTAKLDEVEAQHLAKAFTEYLHNCRDAGFANITPGRFLLPGDLEGSPALTFAPLPPTQAPNGSLHRAFERRFEAYRRQVVQPFFRDHFARVDRQVVLVDLLGALNSGPEAVRDLRESLSGVLNAFRPGKNSWLSTILGRRVDRILFAATKADHLHHLQHDRLAELMGQMVQEAAANAKFSGAEVQSMALASLKATQEQEVERGGQTLHLVRGLRDSDRAELAIHPGTLPADLAGLLSEPPTWDSAGFAATVFAPPQLESLNTRGLPHVRLDRAAQFLFGDKL
ncbi:MAG: YcjX family protein [Pseudomonadota bacterium]